MAAGEGEVDAPMQLCCSYVASLAFVCVTSCICVVLSVHNQVAYVITVKIST